MKQWMTTLLVGVGVSLVAGTAFADFDWGTDCSDGEGTFTQAVPFRAYATVGTIPAGKRGVEVLLDAENDVDVQLIDVATGAEIIAWPNGLVSSSGEGCATFEGLEYCYSGYNGTNGNYGDEYIRVNGATNRDLEMRIYGYQAGDAQVNYRWSAVPTCNEVGDGVFSQYVPYSDSIVVGEIPTDKVNVTIELDSNSGQDIDVRLFAGDTALVAWPDGLMSGAGPQELTYNGMTISYSGYNGIDGDWGNERIEISGLVTEALRMEAFGYQAGDAQVTYSWGAGVGDLCGGIANIQCADGLTCKSENPLIPDASGVCHTPTWCEASTDCRNLTHPGSPGGWSCNEFLCEWFSTRPPVDACGHATGVNYLSHDPEQCAVMRFTCDFPEEMFSDACGCGCDQEILYQ